MCTGTIKTPLRNTVQCTCVIGTTYNVYDNIMYSGPCTKLCWSIAILMLVWRLSQLLLSISWTRWPPLQHRILSPPSLSLIISIIAISSYLSSSPSSSSSYNIIHSYSLTIVYSILGNLLPLRPLHPTPVNNPIYNRLHHHLPSF